MELTGRVGRRILLYSLLLLIVPMVFFPTQFGIQLAKASLVTALYELVFYGVVVFFFNRRVTLVQMLQGGGLCLVYRLGLGVCLGLLIAAMYGLNIRVAVTMGMSSYLPAIILQVIGTPFVLRPALLQMLGFGSQEARTRRISQGPERPARRRAVLAAVHQERTPETKQRVEQPMLTSDFSVSGDATEDLLPSGGQGDDNGFDRAVRYIGEHGAVSLACVIDHEGLLVSSFKRGEVEPEEWAPLALSFVADNSRILARSDLGSPQKVDMTLEERRVVVAREGSLCLMVVAERQSDEILNIRINQATEMIAKFVAERYEKPSVINTEKYHV